LEDVRETEEACVVNLGARGREQRGANLDDELLGVSKFQPAGAVRDICGVEPESEGGVAIRVEPRLLDYPHVMGTLPGE
jgi:hypothetical protein